MKYFVSNDSTANGCGSKDRPFKTIQEAAAIAVAGDEIIVLPGIYREYVNPANGGSATDNRITYTSAESGKAVITGAEPVTNWIPYDDKLNVFMTRIPNSIFGSYNPYTTIVSGDWYFSPEPYHTGEVYLNNKSLYEVLSLEEVINPTIKTDSWDLAFTKHVWFTTQDGEYTIIYANFQGADPNKENVEINVRRNCFFPENNGINYITLSGFTITKAATTWAPPTAFQDGMVGPNWAKGWIIEDCDISNSKCSGISIGKYLQPNNNNKWTTKFLKDGTQTERDAICQARNEGWTKGTIGSHIIRRCNIYECGQTGIVGHLGGVFSLIEDNHIHHINNKRDLGGAEIGGIKMHAAIDVTIRRNHIHNCSRGLWLDWQAQGTRVTSNLFHDNMPPADSSLSSTWEIGEDIFVEVSHGPTLIDNNLLLSTCSARISTQGIALLHNLIAGSFTWVGSGTDNGGDKLPTPRYTPYHVPHSTDIAGFMTFLHGDARFYNNIFIQMPIPENVSTCVFNSSEEEQKYSTLSVGTYPYNGYPTKEEYFSQFTLEGVKAGYKSDLYYDHLPIYTGGNIYFNGAKPCDKESNFVQVQTPEITFSLTESSDGLIFETNLYDNIPDVSTSLLCTEALGEAFEPEQLFENPDGTAIVFDSDYFGNHRGIIPLPGPFENQLSKYILK